MSGPKTLKNYAIYWGSFDSIDKCTFKLRNPHVFIARDVFSEEEALRLFDGHLKKKHFTRRTAIAFKIILVNNENIDELEREEI